VQPNVADFPATSRTVIGFSRLVRELGPTVGDGLDPGARPARPARAFLWRSDFERWAAASPIASGPTEVRQLGGQLADEPCRSGVVESVAADVSVMAEATSAGDPFLVPHRWVAAPARCEPVRFTRTIADPSGRFIADAASTPSALLNGSGGPPRPRAGRQPVLQAQLHGAPT
jgi:hypothetical protein